MLCFPAFLPLHLLLIPRGVVLPACHTNRLLQQPDGQPGLLLQGGRPSQVVGVPQSQGGARRLALEYGELDWAL